VRRSRFGGRCRQRRTRFRSPEIDEQQDVVAALAQLTPRQRAALVLTDVLDYSSEEAGRALGVSAGTVRGLASRARENLRRQVGERT